MELETEYMAKNLLMMKEGDAMRITPKQKEIVDCIKFENPKILICSGAKRA